jgi:hypothetical protein
VEWQQELALWLGRNNDADVELVWAKNVLGMLKYYALSGGDQGSSNALLITGEHP